MYSRASRLGKHVNITCMHGQRNMAYYKTGMCNRAGCSGLELHIHNISQKLAYWSDCETAHATLCSIFMNT